jgi:hypothetical protein
MLSRQAAREIAQEKGHEQAHLQACTLSFFILSNNDPKSWAEMVDRTIHIHGKFLWRERRGR